MNLSIEFENLGVDDYARAKALLNKARHPGFVGRELYYRCASSGVVCLAKLESVDCGIAMIAAKRLQVLSVITAAQGKGIGSALMRRLQPEWVTAISERVSFFERLGYKTVGAPKIGQSGKHATQLLQRDESVQQNTTDNGSMRATERRPESPPLTLLSELADETPRNRSLAQLQILDGLIERAIAAERYEVAVKLMVEARVLFGWLDKERERKS